MLDLARAADIQQLEIKAPQSFLSQLESLRDLVSVATARYGSLLDFFNSLPEGPKRDQLSELIQACSRIQSLASPAEATLVEKISMDQFKSARLPQAAQPQILASRERLPHSIDLDKVIIIPKISKIEYYRRKKDITLEQAKAELKSQHGDISALEAADRELNAATEEFLKFFRPAQIVDQDKIDSKQLKDASLVIALGGDDHFCFVAQQIKGELPVLGVKADTQSVGALIDINMNMLDSLVLNLDNADYRFESWSRLKISIDGKKIPSTLSTIFIGDGNSQRTSRFLIQVEDSNGKKLYGTEGSGIEQRSSGALIATGTGSTGWASSASLYIYPKGHTFARDARYVSYVLREPTVPDLAKANSLNNTAASEMNLPALNHFYLHEGERIIIQSLNKEGGIINADSVCVPFVRGSKVTIEIDPEPLWVIVPKDRLAVGSVDKINLETLSAKVCDPKLGIVSRNHKDLSYPERLKLSGSSDWETSSPDYQPQEFNHPKLLTAEWAESADISLKEFNARLVSGELRSFMGQLKLCPKTGRPLNPIGRTGISGRGVLGKWGANFAVDPIVISKDPKTGEYSLLVIERKDGGWALPGGMVDKGESVTDALFRELEEETKLKREDLDSFLIRDWSIDTYADDRRATDNAWIETSARLLLIPDELKQRLLIEAGDDAAKVKWLKLDPSFVDSLYGSHAYMVLNALKHLGQRKS